MWIQYDFVAKARIALEPTLVMGCAHGLRGTVFGVLAIGVLGARVCVATRLALHPGLTLGQAVFKRLRTAAKWL